MSADRATYAVLAVLTMSVLLSAPFEVAAQEDGTEEPSAPAGFPEGEQEEEEEEKPPSWEVPEDLRSMLEAMERFEEAARTYRQEVQLLVEWKYEERREQLLDQYERAISRVEEVERTKRLDAIARFEAFVARYPDEPRYSPDAMMRLAELLYERIEDEHRLAEMEYYAEIEEMAPGSELPPRPHGASSVR